MEIFLAIDELPGQPNVLGTHKEVEDAAETAKHSYASSSKVFPYGGVIAGPKGVEGERVTRP
jgi:hypothetical protein